MEAWEPHSDIMKISYVDFWSFNRVFTMLSSSSEGIFRHFNRSKQPGSITSGAHIDLYYLF